MTHLRSFSGLNWVSGELYEVIRKARDALEEFVEGGGEAAVLGPCVEDLNQVRGVLEMLQLSGASRLADEMQLLATKLRDEVLEKPQEAAEALMLAMIQLPDYLEKLESGGDDIPLLLLPAINDLRGSRGAGPLDEADLVVSGLVHGSSRPAAGGEQQDRELTQAAQRIRPRIHKSLLAWFRDQDPQLSVGELSRVFEELEQAASWQPMLRGVFRTAHAVAEGLREGSIDSSPPIKGLVGRVDRIIKTVAEKGPDAAVEALDRKVIWELLSHVAKADSASPAIQQVKADYDLLRAFPSAEELDKGRERLLAPAADAIGGMRSAAVKELLPIKDTLDLYMRGGRDHADQLLGLQEPLRRLANILEMSGQPDLGDRLRGRAADLLSIGEGEAPEEDALLMRIAGDLLYVESSLDNLSQQRLDGQEAVTEQGAEEGVPQGEIRSLIRKTLDEAAVDMAKTKEAIAAFMEAPSNIRLLEGIPPLFHEVAGALRVISHADAAAILDDISQYISKILITQNKAPDGRTLELLADGITGIDYYMEGVAEDRRDLADILSISRNALERLWEEHAAIEEEISGLVDMAMPDLLADETQEASGGEALETPRIEIPEEVDSSSNEADIDHEIMEIFLEEAREELPVIRDNYARWRENPDDQEALAAFRRSFHTLKGSGRLAGAATIGEFSWSIENLLNRIIDQTLPVSDSIRLLLDRAVGALPELIDAQESGRTAEFGVDEIAEQATAMTEGRFSEVESKVVPLRPEIAVAEAEMEETEEGAEEEAGYTVEDTELREIFETEATEHLGVIGRFVDACVNTQPPYAMDEELIRAFHTLAGSARMTGLDPIAEVAKGIERKVAALVEADRGAGNAFFELLSDGFDEIKAMVATLSMPDGPPLLPARELVARIESFDLERPDLSVMPSAETSVEPITEEDASAPISPEDVDAGSEPLEEPLGLEGIDVESLEEETAVEPPRSETAGATEAREPEAEEVEWISLEELQAAGLEVGTSDEAEETTVDTVQEEPQVEAGEFEEIELPGTAAEEPARLPELAAEVDEYEQVASDPELVEIFLEEARELSQRLNQDVSVWSEPPVPADAAERLQRTLHTLKGAARLADIHAIGDLSHRLEDFFKGRTDQDAVTAEERQLAADGAAAIARQLLALESGEAVPRALTLLERLRAEPGETIAGEVATEAGGGEPAQAQASAEAVPAPQLEEISADPELVEIFLEEAEDLVDQLEGNLREWESDPDNNAIPDRIKRTLHTLKGGARLADITSIGDLSHALESLLEGLPAGAEREHGGLLPLAQRAADRIADQVDSVRQGGPVQRALDLIEELGCVHQEPVAAPPEAAAVPSSGAEAEVELPELAGTAQVEEAYEAIASDRELIEIFLEEAEDLLEQLDGTLREWETDPANDDAAVRIRRTLHTLKGGARLAGITSIGDLSHALETLLDGLAPGAVRDHPSLLPLAHRAADRLVDQVESVRGGGPVRHATLLIEELEAVHGELSGIAPQVPAPVSAPAAARKAVAEVEVQPREEELEAISADPELTGIFLEEAEDLVDQLETNLRGWSEEPTDADIPVRLKRILHTLKGSARLAGITSIGDLSHALETLLEGLPEGAVRDHASLLPLAQRAADRIADQVDSVRQGGPVRRAGGLIEELEYVHDELTGAPPRAVEETPAPAAPAAEALSTVDKAAAPAAPEPVRAPPMQEQVRVRSDVLNRLVNNAGEISIYRARLEEQNTALGFNLNELEQTVSRLHDQLRQMDIETEAQILYRYEQEREASGGLEEEFDPLELDRFSTIQQLSRSLMETVNDLVSIKSLLGDQQKESETLLLQHSRISNDLQDGLLRTRMVPFTQMVPRLHRVVRQTAAVLNKRAVLEVFGAEGEMDRSILERMQAPMEHILRNAVSHGIETPERRVELGKDQVGRISVYLSREGNDVVITVSDDGAGLNLAAIRKRAEDIGLLEKGAIIDDDDVMQLVLEPGFTTSKKVTQISGRGVGTDVVVSEVKQLGGSLEIDSQPGWGTSFTIRLPFTLAISEALLVQLGDEIFAVPHPTIEGVVRINLAELMRCYDGTQPGFHYAGHDYHVRYLGNLLGTTPLAIQEGRKWLPLLLVRSGEHRVAIQIDQILGNKQIVVKSVGSQLASVRWISGGTILADGRVALILDVSALVRMDLVQSSHAPEQKPQEQAEKPVKVMVVDDSITVRKVTTRLLKRHNMEVTTAKDGVDAVAQLQEHHPDVMLLDIEMPRMDGYELARHVRNSAELRDIPIIMITSRSGEKHRKIAMSLGVRRYLGKPYQEGELLDNIYAVLAESEVEA